jgi:hypothetical protein
LTSGGAAAVFGVKLSGFGFLWVSLFHPYINLARFLNKN